jgi:polysaccharide export outer membrane protein
VREQTAPPFHQRFKKYLPPAELKIAVGDQLSVVIWEASPEGLFGYSLWDVAGESLGTAVGSIVGGLQAQSAPSSAAALGSNPFGAAQAQNQAALAGAAALGLSQSQPTAPNSLQPQTQNTGFGTVQPQGQSSSAEVAALLRAAAQGQLPASAQSLAALKDAVETGRPGTRIPVQQVGIDGAITIPYAGRVPVAGRTPAEVQRTIERRLAGKAVEPQALVFVHRSVANSVSIAGEVVGGKRISLNPGGERLLQVIAAAGGAQAPVHETFVQLSRDGVTATVPLASVIDNPDEDIFVQPGDVITLVRRPQTFSAFGATGRNTAITFNRDRLSLSEALAQAHGLLDYQADPRAVFLFRYEPETVVRALGQPLATRAPAGVSPIAYRLDLLDPKAYLLAEQFPVRDKDIIFVANSEIQPLYQFFTALQNITGPVVTGLLVCQGGNC